ncbi:isoaspartyl peptidase/L-asparaginase [Permianibacter sp. IMCC34836]|uniref:isoaspartyl peptidase/L-asparaginase family protein n=1 Tax=Permianibacter fluminis TaxID=2738515 RepID=UPI0015524835|nr:isoaspartyl peptidase/L-asparaginase [Permianibacter fluminis]NQD38170.1 isoaspartyl peptidase/L-asparaginase [Permianibacter fluminis]
MMRLSLLGNGVSSIMNVARMLGVLAMVSTAALAAAADQSAPIAIAIHGGAGTILRSDLTPELEAQYRATLAQALDSGYAVLKAGGSSLDAVEASVRVMEDSPLFNAGKGAVFSHDGKNELDAAIMDGSTLAAGAIAGVTIVKNPITLARRVMDSSPHVLLIGAGAEAFARTQPIELVDPAYFHTERRWQQLQILLEKEKAGGAKGATGLSEDADQSKARKQSYHFTAQENRFGTVGAVALDSKGHLAAATSTGGMTNKRWGRVGDAPVIGAGTYANALCAVSATGHGEYFIRAAVAHDICARVEYLKQPLAEAASAVVKDKLVKLGGEGGIIAVDAQGNVTLPFNSTGMYRASINQKGERVIAIYAD